MAQCKERTEVYSRIVGYFRPVQQWNVGKFHEYSKRKTFRTDTLDSDSLKCQESTNAATSDQRVSGNIAP